MKLSRMLLTAAMPMALMACSAETADKSPAPLAGIDAPAEPATDAPLADAGEAKTKPWMAQGNEPGWTVTLDGTTLSYVYAYGESRYEAPQPEAEAVEGGKRYTTADGVLSVLVLDKICADDMSGMPFPQTVTVQMEDARVNGCGGKTSDLIEGEWQIVEVNGPPVMPGVELTLVLEADIPPEPGQQVQYVPGKGGVSGRSGCNSYGGEYTLTGEGISFGDIANTEMACDPEIMAQEADFLDALRHVTVLTFDETGEMELRDHEYRQIYARRK
ncbi:META domain-containing protein [Hyphomonas sp. WL0036]|uniref:META domain-containing protein n=1 Tax=Hyphomonas sediminis TaxID=2866160 RepID=UPI001C814578|nr:META domain-containing protein [Hyphomonas sediminis]MBY9068290.1 META domain-containing protein [Hyphomonas sediminis]